MVAEDEENCGTQSSSLQCESRFHNPKSSAVYATVFNVTYYLETQDYDKSFLYDYPVIRQGTIVYNHPSRCDGTVECYDHSDEHLCGFNTFETLFTGK